MRFATTARAACLLSAVGFSSACGDESALTTTTPASVARGAPVEFAFGTTQGQLLDSSSVRGRVTALLFVTTFDLASQVQARQLNEVARSHKPRINVAAVVLEPPKYAVFAETFRTSLALSYPVALADAATLDGVSDFGKIEGVPTLIVLDRRGRIAWRKFGVLTPGEMRRALDAGGP